MNEEFYKRISKKYIDTYSNEVLLLVDDKLHHLVIDDEFLDKIPKLNKSNYKDYLYDGYDDIYDNYEDFVENILDSIKDDLYTNGAMPSGYWDFYLSEDELNKLDVDYSEYMIYPSEFVNLYDRDSTRIYIKNEDLITIFDSKEEAIACYYDLCNKADTRDKFDKYLSIASELQKDETGLDNRVIVLDNDDTKINEIMYFKSNQTYDDIKLPFPNNNMTEVIADFLDEYINEKEKEI